MKPEVDAHPNRHPAIRPQARVAICSVFVVGEEDEGVDGIERREGELGDDKSFGAIRQLFGVRTRRFWPNSAGKERSVVRVSSERRRGLAF